MALSDGLPSTANERPFDHAPAGRTRLGRPRLITLDVTRAVALLGVIVMNYHGYLNDHGDIDASGRVIERSLAERMFHPVEGILATRFAATFVLVAGMGVALLTDRARRQASHHTGRRAEVVDDRRRLVRRGVLLYSVGFVLDWIWKGNIIFYDGAYFMIAALLITLRSRTIAVLGMACAVAAAVISQWRFVRELSGHDTSWLDPQRDSPRNLLVDTLLGGTHPVLPWLTFFCAGIVLGRMLDRLPVLRRHLLALGVGLLVVTYAISAAGPATPDRLGTIPDGSTRRDALIGHLLSTRPYDRGLLYTIGTLGSSVAAFVVVAWLAERFARTTAVVTMQRAGQTTLSLYGVHVAAYLIVVDVFHAVRPTGLDTAVVLALTVWVAAVAAGAWWQRRLGQGPLERAYRAFGG